MKIKKRNENQSINVIQAYVTFYARHLFKHSDLELFCLLDHIAYYLARKISVFLLVGTVFLRSKCNKMLDKCTFQVHDDQPR